MSLIESFRTVIPNDAKPIIYDALNEYMKLPWQGEMPGMSREDRFGLSELLQIAVPLALVKNNESLVPLRQSIASQIKKAAALKIAILQSCIARRFLVPMEHRRFPKYQRRKGAVLQISWWIGSIMLPLRLK